MSVLRLPSYLGIARTVISKMTTTFLSERKSQMCMHLDVFIMRWGKNNRAGAPTTVDCLDPL